MRSYFYENAYSQYHCLVLYADNVIEDTFLISLCDILKTTRKVYRKGGSGHFGCLAFNIVLEKNNDNTAVEMIKKI